MSKQLREREREREKRGRIFQRTCTCVCGVCVCSRGRRLGGGACIKVCACSLCLSLRSINSSADLHCSSAVRVPLCGCPWCTSMKFVACCSICGHEANSPWMCVSVHMLFTFWSASFFFFFFLFLLTTHSILSSRLCIPLDLRGVWRMKNKNEQCDHIIPNCQQAWKHRKRTITCRYT